MKQQGTTCLTEWQIAKLIKNNQIHMHEAVGNLPLFTRELLLLKGIDQFNRR